MALKPLTQWICDRCGEVIAKPEDGWVHWRTNRETHKVSNIGIVHHLTASPKSGELGCYPERMESDMHLTAMLGPRGIVDLLSMMDVGEYHDPDARHVGGVADVRNWVEVFRRLHVPYYEEARLHFKEARANGDLDGINEVALYLPDTLKQIVEDYA